MAIPSSFCSVVRGALTPRAVSMTCYARRRPLDWTGSIGPMRLVELVETSAAVAANPSRLEKIGRLAELVGRVPPDEIEIAIAFLRGSLRQGKIGVGGAVLSGMRSVEPALSPTLSLRDVNTALERVAAASGSGSAGLKA